MLPGDDLLLETIRRGVIGDDQAMDGPFGRRRVTYADYTASGRSLAFLEDYLRHEVMPRYANTHTESSGTGLQTTRLREDARRIVLETVGGGDDDLVLFCGSGATAAIDRLIGILNLRIPADLDDRWRLRERIPAEARPVVFLGPYEHHSNEIPWRETIAEVVVIDESADGRIDLGHLERELVRHAARPLRIGTFSAASNVTGIETDTRAIASLLHRHGALSFWDFAAAGPYLDVDMNAAGAPKDAVFLSPHKFVGGPGTPGVLVVKRRLVRNRVPVVPGGGTVAYVNPDHHRYLDDPVQREEGGTPAILESIRAGLVFQLRRAVGAARIQEREESFLRRAVASWSANPNLRLLGNLEAPRLSIVSFVIRHDDGFLHHNYVVALLNDVFGIQSRGGCSCAGPYGHRLLGIDRETSRAFEREILAGHDGIKPGWVRINFNYFISEAVFEYVVKAVHLLAEYGWRLLPRYRFDPRTGIWTHRAPRAEPLVSLRDISYASGRMEYPTHDSTLPESALASHLADAERIFEAAPADPGDADPAPDLPEAFEALRWFPLPHEIRGRLAARAKPAAS